MSDALQALVDTPADVRAQAESMLGRAQRIARALTGPATTEEARIRAKDELKALRKEAGVLWSLI